jgi:hypothetical protein
MSDEPAVGISAQKVADSLEKWLEDEIKGRTGRYFDLGKFFFSVSTGLLVFFVTAQKALGSHQCSKEWLLLCITFSILGVVASLLLIWPRNIRIGATLDILAEFNAILRYHRRILSGWFLLTVGGLFAGGLSLISFNAACNIWQ